MPDALPARDPAALTPRAGTPVCVEAYTDADEIEFVLNGTTAARVSVGTGKAFLATADLPYQPGALEAVAYRDGAETGRCRLITAGAAARLRLTPDRPHIGTDPQDLAYLDICLVDEHGTINPISDRTVTVELDGPATLQALGTARPSTEESFQATFRTTYEGHALAVLRPTGAEGPVTVTVRADGLPPATVTIDVRQPSDTVSGTATRHEPARS